MVGWTGADRFYIYDNVLGPLKLIFISVVGLIVMFLQYINSQQDTPNVLLKTFLSVYTTGGAIWWLLDVIYFGQFKISTDGNGYPLYEDLHHPNFVDHNSSLSYPNLGFTSFGFPIRLGLN
jgi:hypothetical protein